MTIKFGGAGSDVTLGNPTSINMDGDQVTFAGTAKSVASQADWQVLRDQLRGLVGNPDEPVVPIVLSHDATHNGFYNNVRVSVPTDPAGWANKFFPWQVQAQRIPDFAFPLCESSLLGGLRTNSLGFVAGTVTPWWVFPACTIDGDAATRSTLDLVRILDDGPPSPFVYALTTGLSRQVLYFTPAPSMWYQGGCYLKWKYGSNQRRVVSRYVPGISTLAGASLVVPDHTGVWEIGNHAVKVTPYQSGTTFGGVSVSYYQGGAWSTAIDLTITPTAGGLTTFTVIRNEPAAVTVRVGLASSPASNLDIVIRRGANFAEFSLTNRTVQAWRVNFVGASTAITGGLTNGSTGSTSLKYTLVSPRTQTNKVTADSYLAPTTSAVDFPFAVGPAVGNGGGGWTRDPADMLTQYLGASTERVAFVSR